MHLGELKWEGPHRDLRRGVFPLRRCGWATVLGHFSVGSATPIGRSGMERLGMSPESQTQQMSESEFEGKSKTQTRVLFHYTQCSGLQIFAEGE